MKKQVKKNNKKLLITLGTGLLATTIMTIPMSSCAGNSTPDVKKNYEDFTPIGGESLTFDKDRGNENTLGIWSTLKENGSYYLKIDEKTYVDTDGNPERFVSFGQEDMDPNNPELEDLAILFNQKNSQFMPSGSQSPRIYLTDKIKNLTIIFGEDLVYPIVTWTIASSNQHTEKVVLNIEDRTPTIENKNWYSELYVNDGSIKSPVEVNVTLTKTSGSRGHTKQEWMDKLKITDESLFSLNEQ